MQLVKLIYKYAKKYWLLFIIAEVCILITYTVSLLLPMIFTDMVDNVIYAKQYEKLNKIIYEYIILFLISIITNMFYYYVWQKLYNNFVVDIKCDVYKKVIRSKAENLSSINSGDIMSRIDWDCDQFI